MRAREDFLQTVHLLKGQLVRDGRIGAGNQRICGEGSIGLGEAELLRGRVLVGLGGPVDAGPGHEDLLVLVHDLLAELSLQLTDGFHRGLRVELTAGTERAVQRDRGGQLRGYVDGFPLSLRGRIGGLARGLLLPHAGSRASVWTNGRVAMGLGRLRGPTLGLFVSRVWSTSRSPSRGLLLGFKEGGVTGQGPEATGALGWHCDRVVLPVSETPGGDGSGEGVLAEEGDMVAFAGGPRGLLSEGGGRREEVLEAEQLLPMQLSRAGTEKVLQVPLNRLGRIIRVLFVFLVIRGGLLWSRGGGRLQLLQHELDLSPDLLGAGATHALQQLGQPHANGILSHLANR